MDIRWVLGAITVFFIWAYNTKVQFVLAGHLFMIPVIVLLSMVVLLATAAALAFILWRIWCNATPMGAT